MEKTVEIEVIKKVLMLYDVDVAITEQKSYIHAIEDNGWLKLIFRVTLASAALLCLYENYAMLRSKKNTLTIVIVYSKIFQ